MRHTHREKKRKKIRAVKTINQQKLIKSILLTGVHYYAKFKISPLSETNYKIWTWVKNWSRFEYEKKIS